MIKISAFLLILIFSQFSVGGPECRKAKTYVEKNKNTIDWVLSRNFDNPDLDELKTNLRRRNYDLTDEASTGEESHELNCNRNLKIVHHVVVFLLREYKKAHPPKPAPPPAGPLQPTEQTPQGGQPQQTGQTPQEGQPQQTGQTPQEGQPQQTGQTPQEGQPQQTGQTPQ